MLIELRVNLIETHARRYADIRQTLIDVAEKIGTGVLKGTLYDRINNEIVPYCAHYYSRFGIASNDEIAGHRSEYPPKDQDGRTGMYCDKCDAVFYVRQPYSSQLFGTYCPFCEGVIYYIDPDWQPANDPEWCHE